MTTTSNLRGFILIVLVCCALVSGVIFDYLPAMIDVGIKRHIQLATNDEIIGFWSKPPFDIHTYYWLYNVTNPDEFMSGQKAIVGRVGPYHFTSRMTKNIIEYSDNKYRVTFNSTRVYRLDEASLDATFDTPIMSLNPIYAALTENVRERVRLVPGQAATIVGSVTKLAEKFNETLLMSVAPRQLLLGRHSVFVDKAKKLAETFGQELSGTGVSSTVGYVSMTNATQTGPFQIFTGYQASAPSLGELISFQGRKRGVVFSGACNRIQTSIGELRPMPIETNSRLEMYQPMLDRIVHLKPTGQRRTREGIALNYMFDELDFESAQVNPELACFCSKGTLDSYCSLRGAIELAPVVENVPIVFTVAHIDPDPRIKSSIANWDPELVSPHMSTMPDGENNTHMLILKRFGIPYKLDLAVTLYMKVTKDPAFKQTAHVPDVTYMPILTQREVINVPDNFIKPIVDLEAFLNLTRHLKLVMYLTTLILLAWLSSMLYRRTAASTDRIAPSAGNLIDDLEPGDVAILGVATGASGGAVATFAIGQPIGVVDVNGQPMDKPNGQVRRSSVGVPLEPSAPQGAARSQLQPQRAVIFSKIDEDIMTRQMQLNTRGSKAGLAFDEQPNAGQSSAPGSSGANSQTLRRRSSVRAPTVSVDAASPDESRASSIAGSMAAGDDASATAAEQQARQLRPPGRRNWFIRVYTDVVRVLTDFRLSISNASQLDIRENDSQDRQLEMLAGKIDNWYTGHEGGSTTPNQESESGVQPEQQGAEQRGKARPEPLTLNATQPDSSEAGGLKAATPPTTPKLGMQDESSQTTLDKSSEAGELEMPASDATAGSDAKEQPKAESGEADNSDATNELGAPEPSEDHEQEHEADDLIDESDNNVELDSDKDTDAVDKAKALQQLEQTIAGDESAPSPSPQPPKDTTTATPSSISRGSVRRQAGTAAAADSETESQGPEPDGPDTELAGDTKTVEEPPAPGESVDTKRPGEVKDMRRDSGVKLESQADSNVKNGG